MGKQRRIDIYVIRLPTSCKGQLMRISTLAVQGSHITLGRIEVPVIKGN